MIRKYLTLDFILSTALLSVITSPLAFMVSMSLGSTGLHLAGFEWSETFILWLTVVLAIIFGAFCAKKMDDSHEPFRRDRE
jgi:ABC-type multidrug transport system permease subunit